MTAEEKARADASVRAWVAVNSDRRKAIARAWARKWRDANAEKVADQSRRYRPKQIQRDRVRYQSDANYRIRVGLRSKLYQAVHRLPHKTRELEKWGARSTVGPLIGCSPVDLMNHLQGQFQVGMSWDNHGLSGWEIDHIKPCAAFDLTDPNQRRACFHYSNLRPLWRKDNQAARRMPD
jgi:hypothetical protein